MTPQIYNKSELLSAMDIELIIILQYKDLIPTNREELYECLNVVQDDVYSMERLMAHTRVTKLSLVDYYSRYSDQNINLILTNLKTIGGRNER